MSKVLETTKFVIDHSVNVKINKEKIAEFFKGFHHGILSHWLSASPISYSHLNDTDKLNLLLVFNSTSFCYWGDPKWTIEYKGEQYDGSWAMMATILRAIDEGKPILNAKYRVAMSKEEYRQIMRGNVEIPLLEERWNIMRNIAAVLVEKYDGDFGKLILGVNGDAAKLLELIIIEFNSFEDSALYEGKQIYFYKRAQLLVEDIYQTFSGKGCGNLTNLDGFTACADYKLPQSLRKLGIISYAKELSGKIDNFIQIPKGSPEEIEIRANTIWAVEMIKEELKNLGREVSSAGINDHLWLMGQTKSPDDKPYHRTLTTAY
jgi:hypothetical protein